MNKVKTKKIKQNYDADFFIQKFRKIPENRWITGKYHVGSQHCALGHCGYETADELSPKTVEMRQSLSELFDETLLVPVTKVNDFNLPLEVKTNKGTTTLVGKTPRQRILNALKTIKTMKQNKIVASDASFVTVSLKRKKK